MMFTLTVGMGGRSNSHKSISIRWADARRALNERGFVVENLRKDAWNLSCLPRIVDPAHTEDIHWKSPYDQLLRFVDIARDLKIEKGLLAPMPIHLPTLRQLRLIGGDNLRRLFENPEAMKMFKERAVGTEACIADLSILPLMFDRFIRSA